jgi:hypothetical protein
MCFLYVSYLKEIKNDNIIVLINTIDTINTMSLHSENKYMSYRDATLNCINVNTNKNIKIAYLNIKTNYVKKKSIKYCTKCNYPCILEQNDGSVYEYKILTIIKKSK